jgi:DNA-binding GntR family transcriptional regulator
MTNDQRKQFDELTKLLEEAVEAKDRIAWARIDLSWHTFLCNACPNELLGQMVLQAFHHMRIQGVVPLLSTESLIPGTREHREVADAILAGDSLRAAELMHFHLQSARERMFRREG